MFCGESAGLEQREFRKITQRSHKSKTRKTDDAAARAAQMLQNAGIRTVALTEDETLDLYWSMLNPELDRMAPTRTPDRPQQLARQAERLQLRTIREYLLQSNLDWNKNHLQVGGRFCKVLTLSDLPDKTSFMDVELFYDLDFDFWLSTTIHIPDQRKYRASLDQQRRFNKADAGRGGNIEDYKRTGRRREGEELAELLAETGQRLVLVCSQAVVTAPTQRLATFHTNTLKDKTRSKGYIYFEEKHAHDREFFKCLPGLSSASTRHLLMTSNNAVDLLPLAQEDHGDRAPVLVVKTQRGELFSFNPFEQTRDNWNATIFGASGSGKSVFCNLLIATSILANTTKGRLIVIDFAGETKSSYLMLAKLFGGEFVPVLSEKCSLNPFPHPSTALDKDNKVKGETETFLTILTDILLANTGQDKENQLFRHLIQRAIRDTYRKTGDIAPTYTSLLDTLRSYQNDTNTDQARLKTVLDLLTGFLESPSARLFNRQSTVTPQSPFLIMDLYGLDSLESHIAEAITFLTTQWVKQLAFDASDPGYKYIILDEVAQLIKRQEMVGLLDELYSTARKHQTSVWTVTQSYQTYRQSALANTIKLNSTTQIFLSHASDEAGRRQIAEDYHFSRREKHLFDHLRTVKGRYSNALIRTQSSDPDGKDKHYLTSVLQIDLSPLDYEICTSDAADRDLQRKYLNANPGQPLHKVLEHIGNHKRG